MPGDSDKDNGSINKNSHSGADSESSEAVLQNQQSSKNNSADAQIQAHKQQHHQQKTKLFGTAAVLLLIVIITTVAYFIFTRETSINEGAPPAKAEQAIPDAQLAKFREDFKQALTQYEENVQPNINELMLSDWQTNAASELALMKDQAVTAFAQGAFAQAKQIIDALYEKSEALIAGWQAQILQYVDEGQQAFNSEDIAQAQLQVNKALALSSTHIKAMELQNRIYAHGEASKLVAELKIAVFENNWPKQVEVLTDIIQIDPARTELADDLAAAKQQHNMQLLAKYLDQAATALRENQLTKAMQFVDKAKTIAPNSNGATALVAQINQAKAQQSLGASKSQILAAVKQDDWEQVNVLATAALALHANDDSLRSYQNQAQQILIAHKSLAPFIAAPHRLADDNIRQAATNAVQSAFAASLLSPKLANTIEQVAGAIDNYNKPVEVSINSDGKTYIIVLGVGHVGEHKQKTVSLTPGKYILQGKREGFRNKRLEFIVTANKPLSLNLVCDERI